MTEKIENNLNLTLSERYNNYDWPKVPTEEEINLRNILIPNCYQHSNNQAQYILQKCLVSHTCSNM